MRPMLVALVLAAATPAVAQEGAQVCLVEARETMSGPKKPSTWSTALNCGTAPDPIQAAAMVAVERLRNPADALNYMTSLGYRLVNTGHVPALSGYAIHHYYSLVRPRTPSADTAEGGALAPSNGRTDGVAEGEPVPISPDER